MSRTTSQLAGSGAGADEVQGNAAAGATDVGNPVKTGGVYLTSAPTLSNGQRGDTQMDINANTKTREQYAAVAEDNTNGLVYTQSRWAANATAKPTATTNLSFTTATISSAPITIVGVRVINTTASSRYLFLNNATSIAGAAAPTHTPIFVPANGTAYETTSLFTPAGHYYSTALTIGNSSTAATFTAGSAGDLLVTIYTQS